MMNSEYYEKKIADQLKRIADALDELNKRERERGMLVVSVPVYVPQPYRWPWQRTLQPGVVFGRGSYNADPPYTTTSGSWTQIDDDMTPMGETVTS